MQNETLIQFFHWYVQPEAELWQQVSQEAGHLAEWGFSACWLPPAFKGTNGIHSVGYDAYDLFDVGEFDQKGCIRTKYGTKEGYLEAIQALQTVGVSAIADVIFNHKAGGDELETIKVRKVNPDCREEFISDEMQIEAWTKFIFPGRQGKYSAFVWDFQCFSGVDWAENLNESAIYSIQNQYGDKWEEVESEEMGNYDYLMFNDIDFRNPSVRAELAYWGKWYVNEFGVKGFRMDALKHMNPEFIREWLRTMRDDAESDLWLVGEYWETEGTSSLLQYLEVSDPPLRLFDSVLHQRFYEASKAHETFDLSRVFADTLLAVKPDSTVTFVDNHDTQPLQSLETYVDDWFRPLAYALILLRKEGTPCVFYPDIYGATYEENGQEIALNPVKELPLLLKWRKEIGEEMYQQDFFDHPNCIAWIRKIKRGSKNIFCVIIMSNGTEEGYKDISLGGQMASQSFEDGLGNYAGELLTDQEGNARFHCLSKSVSVWIQRFD